jgi:phenylpropionate dioxygenase-like ring-hydroxylating dioxygenase large terminal subunit
MASACKAFDEAMGGQAVAMWRMVRQQVRAVHDKKRQWI